MPVRSKLARTAASCCSATIMSAPGSFSSSTIGALMPCGLASATPGLDAQQRRVGGHWPHGGDGLAARLVPVAAGGLHTFELQVTQPRVAAAMAAVLGDGIYEAGRWLEARPGDIPAARLAAAFARWLLALGLDTRQPM